MTIETKSKIDHKTKKVFLQIFFPAHFWGSFLGQSNREVKSADLKINLLYLWIQWMNFDTQ